MVLKNTHCFTPPVLTYTNLVSTYREGRQFTQSWCKMLARARLPLQSRNFTLVTVFPFSSPILVLGQHSQVQSFLTSR